MDSSQWPQVYESTRPTNKKPILVRPNKEQAALNCPRCNSPNTKFCYYNNYSLSQPRHLCKTCKRYWTEGGNLRNVPVGGGSRKNKRPSTSKKPIAENPNPKTLDLGFNSSLICGGPSGFGLLPVGLDSKHPDHQNPNLGSSENIAFSSLMPAPASNPISVLSSSSFSDFKPSLSFSVLGHGYGNDLEGNPMATSSSRLGFPFDPFSNDQQFDQNGKGQGGSNGSYWHGMIGGGSW